MKRLIVVLVVVIFALLPGKCSFLDRSEVLAQEFRLDLHTMKLPVKVSDKRVNKVLLIEPENFPEYIRNNSCKFALFRGDTIPRTIMESIRKALVDNNLSEEVVVIEKSYLVNRKLSHVLSTEQPAFTMEFSLEDVSFDLVPMKTTDLTVPHPHASLSIRVKMIDSSGVVKMDKIISAKDEFVGTDKIRPSKFPVQEREIWEKLKKKEMPDYELNYDPKFGITEAYYSYRATLMFRNILRKILNEAWSDIRSIISESELLKKGTGPAKFSTKKETVPVRLVLFARKWERHIKALGMKLDDDYGEVPNDQFYFACSINGKLLTRGMLEAIREDSEKRGHIKKREDNFFTFYEEYTVDLPLGKSRVNFWFDSTIAFYKTGIDSSYFLRKVKSSCVYLSESVGQSVVCDVQSGMPDQTITVCRYLKRVEINDPWHHEWVYIGKYDCDFQNDNWPSQFMEEVDWTKPEYELLMNKKPRKRKKAINILANKHGENLENVLLQTMLSDADGSVRELAAEKLCEFIELDKSRSLLLAHMMIWDEWLIGPIGDLLVKNKRTEVVPYLEKHYYTHSRYQTKTLKKRLRKILTGITGKPYKKSWRFFDT